MLSLHSIYNRIILMATDRHLSPAVAITIAGSDNSSGAGIQADLKAFSAFHVYGLSAVTTVVAEIPGHVKSVAPVPLDVIEDQIALSLEAFPVSAAKTGMLWSAEVIAIVHRHLQKKSSRCPVVVDPVMVASSGDPLLQSSAIDAYRELLFPLAALVTPNLDEAQVLLETKITSLAELERAGVELTRRFGVPFLMKGGHLRQQTAVDLLIVEGAVAGRYEALFNPGVPTHGTGCTFSAAITANLALGRSLRDAVQLAKNYITDAINHSCRWGNVAALNHAVAVREMPAASE